MMNWLFDLIRELLYPTESTQGIIGSIFFWESVGILIVTGLFTISYGFFYNWRKYPTGRAAFYVLLSLFAVMVNIVLARGLGEYPGRLIVTVVVYSYVLFTLTRLLVTLWTRYGRSNDRDPAGDDLERRRDTR